ncbi:MAG TPA: hypothetical protein ENN21_05205, partial [Spirochaetes bacterium]|nr:hypothetical protein [Spirochaetota bacterium]
MSKLGYLVDPLREMLQEWGSFLRSHAAGNEKKILCLPCDIVPQELPAAWDFTPLRIPSHFVKKNTVGWYFD